MGCLKLSVVLVALVAILLSNLKSIDSLVRSYHKYSHLDQPYEFLEGNFAPVSQQIFGENLAVEGSLPLDLEGLYARTGPNPVHPEGPYHWFDGDGMIHALRVKAGKASYFNSYVPTPRYKAEKQSDRSLFIRLGDLSTVWGLARLLLVQAQQLLGIIPKLGFLKDGTGNTNLMYHNNRFYALVENAAPFQVQFDDKFGTLQEVGYNFFNNALANSSFTAHPKVDPANGELIFFGYILESPVKAGFWYYTADAAGNVKNSFEVPLPKPTMMHDCAITQHYSIFFDVALRVDPANFFNKSKDHLYSWDESSPSRIAIIPRHATSAQEVRWFELSEPTFLFHTMNAWEDGDEVVVVGMKWDGKFSMWFSITDSKVYLTEWRINLKTGVITVKRLVDEMGEFPRVNENLLGRKTRYGYFASFGDGMIDGIVKHDYEHNTIQKIRYPAGLHGGEAVFVPKHGAVVEDEGYLITYTHHEATQQSHFEVFDAQTMSSTPIAKVFLPQRVPYGFHGQWVTEKDFQKIKV